tara:strand:- start:196 stop:1020 length:825 start_codon:yes stop_codon:yes gene_type:complete
MALNEENNIQECIESIINSGGKDISVLDGGSNDRTEEIAKKNGAKFISFPDTSLSYRRGYAIEESKADFVFFVDADQRLINTKVPNEEIISEYFNKDNQLAGIVYTKIPGSSKQNYWEKGFAMRHIIVSGGGENVQVIGTPCIFRSDYGKQVGFNRELAGSCDDTVFCDRLVEAGFVLKAIPENAIEIVRASLRDTLKKAFWYGKGDSEYVKLYKNSRLRHLFHVLVRGPIIYPLLIIFKKPYLIPFFIIFGLARVFGLFYGLIVKQDLSRSSS